MQAWCFAQQNFHGHVDGAGAARAVFEHQIAGLGGDAHHGKRATLAFTHLAKERHQIGVDGQHIALLAFVAPNLFGCQPAFFQRHLPHVEGCTALRAVHQFWKGVADATCAHVMDGQHRVHLAQGPAMVDDLLRAALNFGVAALHGIKVQRRGVGARCHGARRAPAHANAHARSTELHEQGARRERQLMGLRLADAAQTARQHDGLVITAANAGHILLKHTEVT